MQPRRCRLSKNRVSRERRLFFEALEHRRLLSLVIPVRNTADSGQGSLRQAILDANAAAEPVTIEFSIPTSDSGFVDVDTSLTGGDPFPDVFVIRPLSQLPSISNPAVSIIVDGRSQTTFGGDTNPFGPEIVLDGFAASAAHGLQIDSSGNQVLGLNVQRFNGCGVFVLGSNNVIAGNFVGTDATGMYRAGNAGSGVSIQQGASGNIVGGTDPGARNVVSSNGWHGVDVLHTGSRNNVVLGNYIGTDATGTLSLGNTYHGVVIWFGASDNTIGGTTPAARNLISGNASAGVVIPSVGTNNNRILGNFIGTDVTGSVALGNVFAGIQVREGASGNIIGGSDPGAGNLISGNQGCGIQFVNAGTASNSVLGNYIGTDVNGTSSIPNTSTGVSIGDGASGNFVGDTAPGAGNVISGNGVIGVELAGTGTTENRVLGNIIGADRNGLVPLGNGHGVAMHLGASNNMLGGIEPGARNIISGNRWDGVHIRSAGTTNNYVVGNFIGTDPTGTVRVGNGGNGVILWDAASENFVGGAFAGAGNVISASAGQGIAIAGVGTASNVIAGNFIGTDVTGSVNLENTWHGVSISSGASENTVGGTTVEARNVISGNGIGVEIRDAGTNGNQVLGNYIGTDLRGGVGLGNRWGGIGIWGGASDNMIGGAVPGAGNLISANTGQGVELKDVGTSDNVVTGNYIGTDATGTVALANTGSGVWIWSGASENIVGGTTPGARNIISGNGYIGVAILDAGTNSNVVAGNYIGTDVTGAVALGNHWDGIGIWQGAANNTIGGTTPGAGNVISANEWQGIEMHGAGTTGNLIAGNLIGTDATGGAPLGNFGSGIALWGGASANALGGVTPGAGNVISGNGLNGVSFFYPETRGNSIRGNSIYDNVGLGIDLGGDGVTANDSGDTDTGPNDLQNFPVLSTVWAGNVTVIKGTLDSAADTTYALDFYASTTTDAAGFGEGKRFLGSGTLRTDTTGHGSFLVQLSAEVVAGEFVTGTATDPGGNTSEFSLAAEAVRGGVYVTDVSPQTPLNASSDHLEITFNKPVDLASFTPADVLLTGPTGQVPITDIHLLSGTTYGIYFARLSANGGYTVVIGPHIFDEAGKAMDQNLNGFLGEPDDDCITSLSADVTFPRVVMIIPQGDVSGTTSQIDVVFSEAIWPDSVTLATVTLTRPDASRVLPSEIASIHAVTDSRFRISLVTAQSLQGEYTLEITSDVSDLVGNHLDQNGNNTGGEEDDRYIGTLNLVDLDLLISGAAIGPSQLWIGESCEVSWDGRNAFGMQLQGDWTDGVYLSQDDQWDISDLQMTTASHRGGLADGEQYSQLVTTTLPGVLPGEYYLIVRADIYGGQKESDEGNNAFVLGPVNVGVRELPADGSLTTGELNDLERSDYFAVNLDPGQSLRLSLTSETISSRLAMYVSLGAIPTRASSDYQAASFSQEQEIVLTGTNEGGTCFVLVYGAELADNISAYTLRAEASPLLVSHISPDRYAGTDPVTLSIRGAGFDDETSVRLIGPDDSEYLPSGVRSISSSTLAVTLPAGNWPEGYYDVHVSKLALDDQIITTRVTEAFEFIHGEMISANVGTFRATLIIPSAVRAVGRNTLWIDYENTGDIPMAAPLLTVEASDGALITLDSDERAVPTDPRGWPPPGVDPKVDVLAIGSELQPSVLMPGESNRIPIYYLGLTAPVEVEDVTFALSTLTVDNTVPFVTWDGDKEFYRPPEMDDEAWFDHQDSALVWFGPTLGDYVTRLGEAADYWASISDGPTGDVDSLFTLSTFTMALEESAESQPTPLSPDDGDLSEYDLDTSHEPLATIASMASASSRMTSPFGWRRDPEEKMHDGIDIGYVDGTRLYPVISGEGWEAHYLPDNGRGYGNQVVLRNKDRAIAFTYSHLNAETALLYLDYPSRTMPVGQPDCIIAFSGNSGRGGKYHLHLRCTDFGGWSLANTVSPLKKLTEYYGSPDPSERPYDSQAPFVKAGPKGPGVLVKPGTVLMTLRIFAPTWDLERVTVELAEVNGLKYTADTKSWPFSVDAEKGIGNRLIHANIENRNPPQWDCIHTFRDLPQLASDGIAASVWTFKVTAYTVQGDSSEPQFFSYGRGPKLVVTPRAGLETDDFGWQMGVNTETGEYERVIVGTPTHFRVRLDARPPGNVWVEVSPDDESQGQLYSIEPPSPRSGSGAWRPDLPYPLIRFTPEDWNDERIVTIVGGWDDTADGNTQYHVKLTSIDSPFDWEPTVRVPTECVTITSVDSDAPSVQVEVGNADSYFPGVTSYMEQFEGDYSFARVLMSTHPAAPVTFEAVLTGSGARRVYLDANRVTVYPDDTHPQAWFWVHAINNAVADGNAWYDLTITLRTSDPAYSKLGPLHIRGKVIDNDSGGCSLLYSYDPNDKLGPLGFGEDRYASADRILPYTVFFENDPKVANAPAQEVRIVDRLDEDLDLATFELTELAFANHTIPVSPGRSYYTTTVDLRPEGVAAIVEIEAGLNFDTREFVTSFRAIDPETGWLPEDALVGLLYPNDETHRGEGHVSYIIRPEDNVPTRTQITNQAKIYFDYNDPIDTPQTLNTVDAGKPNSSVYSLPLTSNTSDLTVTWSGRDDLGGSSIAGYSLFVSDDGGDYVLWLEDSPFTQAIYHGEVGHTYAFYSVAIDNVGHRESAPLTADATTYIDIPPVIASLSASRNPVTRGSGLTLTAEQITDLDGEVVLVEFYHGEVVVGVDTNFVDGWNWNGTTSDWGLGEHTLSARAQDNDGAWSEYISITAPILVIENTPPVADAGGPYVGSEGVPITLDASSSFDPENDPLQYRWDFNDDGIWDTEWSTEPAISITWDDNWTGVVGLEVSDYTFTAAATAEVSIDNVAPTAELSNDGRVSYGHAVTINFTDQSDNSSTDREAGFRYAFALDEGSLPASYDAAALNSSLCQVFDAGENTVYGRIFDKDNGYSQYETTVVVTPAPLTVLANDESRIYGAVNPELTGVIEGIMNHDPIMVTYSTVATTASPAGDYLITAELQDSNGRLGNYLVTFVPGTLTVTKADQLLTWNAPSPILYGVPLGEDQLNATVTVAGPAEPGELSYDPLAGTILDLGTHLLTVTVAETENYHAATASVELTVSPPDGAPAASIAGAKFGVRGQPRTFILGAFDPSPEDQAAGFEFNVSWGDGSGVETFTGQSGLHVEHIYADRGEYILEVTAEDRNGFVSDVATRSITVSAAAMQDDPLYPGHMMLVAGGTVGDDTITVYTLGGIQLCINDEVAEAFEPTSRIILYGQDGNDSINLAALWNFAGQTMVWGGGGDDSIIGSTGSDILLGESGMDAIIGGLGDDLIIGGVGSDILLGNLGSDLLISGTTTYDRNDEALLAIEAEWTSGRDYALRIGNITGTNALDDRLNTNYFLTKSKNGAGTVFDDNSMDLLFGGLGQDWFFCDSVRDWALDNWSNERKN